MRKSAIGATCLAAVLTMAGCERAPDGPVRSDQPSARSEADPGAVAMPFNLTADERRGREVYQTMCWSCHGVAGRGDGPAVRAGTVASPPDFTTGEYPRLAAEALQRRFQGGTEPSGRLHMEQVVGFLDAEALRAALAYVPALGWPTELPASALAGREIYSTRCVSCHGFQGRGDGVAVEYLDLPVRPADFTADGGQVARGDFTALFERIKQGGGPVHGSSMPPWGIMLSDPQIWDLVAYTATFRGGLLTPPAGAGRQ